MEIAFVLEVGGAYLGVIFPGAVASAKHCLADDDPGIIVGEDTSVLLIACRIGGDFTIFHHIFGKCGVVEHYAVFTVKMLFNRVKRLLDKAFLESDAGHATQ